MTKTVLIALAMAAVAILLTLMKPRSRKASGDLAARRPLTNREQAMFFRLQAAVPDRIVLAQVAFSALVTTKNRATRATFDRKVADFVICSKGFEVESVIELDDASHKGKAAADAARDAILRSAGYRVIRFANVPDLAEAQVALAAMPREPSLAA